MLTWFSKQWFHPRDSQLLAFYNGGLKSNHSVRLSLHLQKCAHCQKRMEEQQQALQDFQQMETRWVPSSFILPEDAFRHLEQALQARLKDTSLVGFSTQQAGSPAEEYAASTLRALLRDFLGERMALELANSVEDPTREIHLLLSKAAPMFQSFLGERAWKQLQLRIEPTS